MSDCVVIDEPEFECSSCFTEVFAEDELCIDCLDRLEKGELVECSNCHEVCVADLPRCSCGNAIAR